MELIALLSPRIWDNLGRLFESLIDLDFLYYTLSSMDLPSMAKGVKPGINRNDVYKRLIYLPALEEQKHIVSILDAAFIEIEKVNDSVSKLKNNCDAFKTAILKQELQSSEAAWTKLIPEQNL